MPKATEEITTKHIESAGKSLILQLPTAVCRVNAKFLIPFIEILSLRPWLVMLTGCRSTRRIQTRMSGSSKFRAMCCCICCCCCGCVRSGAGRLLT